MTSLTEWHDFYVILGSAAAALTGLQFVAQVLIADLPIRPGEIQASGEAFATPAVVHFVAVLLVAATMVMPWHILRGPSIAVALLGCSGVVYILTVAWRMRKTPYKPVAEDWIFRALLPLCAYLGIALAAILLPAHLGPATFFLAAALLLLLILAIHNAWDNITYLVIMRHESAAKP